MNQTVLNGCALSYEFRRNEASQEAAILFLHGWGCDHTFFDRFYSEFSNTRTVLAVDFPGHGESPEPSSTWGVSDYACQIISLLNELHLQKVTIVAHSFGGRVALKLAAEETERVEKMVITGGAGIRAQAAGETSAKQKQYRKLKKIAVAVGKLPGLRKFSECMMGQLRKKYGSADYNRLSENMRGTFVKVVNEDLTPLLPEIRSSTLLVWGSSDTETPLWMGQKMKEMISDSGLVVFEGRSHFAYLEEPERFLAILKSFL